MVTDGRARAAGRAKMPSVEPDAPPTSRRERLLLLAVLAWTFVSRAYRCGDAFAGIHDWNEAFYALIARNGFDAGLWTPRGWGDPAEGPRPAVFWVTPLFGWLTHGAFRFLGEGEWQARAVPIVSSVATVWAAWRLGRRLFGPVAAILGAALLSCNNMHVVFGRNCQTDGVLTLACVLALGAFVRWIERPSAGALAGAAGWCALGFLTKQTAILLAPAFLLAAVAGRTGWLRSARASVALGVLAVLPAVPWIAWHAARHGDGFWTNFHGHAAREGFFTLRSFWEFHGRTFSPVAWGFVLGAVVWGIRASPGGSPGRHVPLAWAAIVFAATLVAHPGGHTYYVLPMVPALCVLAGAFLAGPVRARLPGGRAAWGGLVVLLLLSEAGFAWYRLVRNKYGRGEVRDLAALLRARHPEPDGARLLCGPDLVGPVGWFYLERFRPVQVRPPDLWGRVRTLAASGERWEVVLRCDALDDQEALVPAEVRALLTDGVPVPRVSPDMLGRPRAGPFFRLYRIGGAVPSR